MRVFLRSKGGHAKARPYSVDAPQKIQMNQLFKKLGGLAWGHGRKGGDEFVGGGGDEGAVEVLAASKGGVV